VPRYFLHLRCGVGAEGLVIDEEGDDLPDENALRQHVLETARDLIRLTRLDAVSNWRACTFEVTDESGRTLLKLPFAEAAH
jgi:hypothetical protein